MKYSCRFRYLRGNNDLTSFDEVSELLFSHAPDGVLVLAWDHVSEWTSSVASPIATMAELASLELSSRRIEPGVLEQCIDPRLSSFYHVESAQLLKAFFKASLEYDDLPLLCLPGDTPIEVANTLVPLFGRIGPLEYESLDPMVPWFLTWCAEDPDTNVACLVATTDSVIFKSLGDNRSPAWIRCSNFPWLSPNSGQDFPGVS